MPEEPPLLELLDPLEDPPELEEPLELLPDELPPLEELDELDVPPLPELDELSGLTEVPLSVTVTPPSSVSPTVKKASSPPVG